MAAPQAVKCLDTSSGRRRFVFKSFSQRVSEIDIGVFRSLHPVKAEPSEGSTFFRDCLVEWRELNTAEDFISFYDEMMPLVQTLPQILLHKERIFSELLRRVNMEAKLSLEPILRLIASLSRDILKEFLPFLQRLVNSFFELFEKGGERDPDVLEQVFTSFSCILMYLQKYLVKDVVNVIEITFNLRYYPKNYIQEFMAEAISFLLRSAPENQLKEGVGKVMHEVIENVSQEKKTGISALLWHVMRGTSSRLHSKAEQVLQLLMGRSILSMHDEGAEGPECVAEVVTETLQRLCEALEPMELDLAWSCLLEEIRCSIVDGHLLHLNRLLSILISVIQFKKGTKICDYLQVFELMKLLIHTYVTPSNSTVTANKVLTLTLGLLDVHDITNGLLPTSKIVLEWAPIFQMGNPMLLGFIKEILHKDHNVLNAFKTQIISALDDLVVSSPDEVLYLLLMFFEREGKSHFFDGLFGNSDAKISNMHGFLEGRLCYWVKVINHIVGESHSSSAEIHESDLAILWGILKIYPHICHPNEEPSSVANLIDALALLLSIEADSIAGFSKSVWQSITGASLSSYHKLLDGRKAGHSDVKKYLNIARKNKSHPRVLSAAAEFLESLFGSMNGKDVTHKFSEFDVVHGVDAIGLFAENLAMSDKVVRVSTLRILSHFASLDQHPSTEDEHPSKKRRAEGSRPVFMDSQDVNVIPLLLSIELVPLTVSTSRKIIILISRIQMNITAGKISDAYISLLLNGLIGILHNRFSYLWQPAIDCLVVLIGRHKDLVWNRFIQCLEDFQLEFLSSGSHRDALVIDHSKPNGLGDCFNLFLAVHSDTTPWGTLVCLLLQTLQKVPEIAESRSRQLVPLFLKFLGYEDEVSRVETFSCHTLNGKEWKSVLKEWLNLFKLLHNSRSLFHSQVLKNVLTYRLLDDTDPDIQLKVLDCLLNWKDDFLLPYSQHLRNLIIAKNLREELTTWTLSKDSSGIQEVHRDFLIPIVIRILVPKVRKLKTLASHKHASVNHRRAILCFLTQLEVNELPLFFSLLLKNLFSNAGGIGAYENDLEGSLEKCLSFALSFLQTESVLVKSLSLKKKFGFLHVVEDILRSFDEFHVKPFLNLLLAIVVKILEECTHSISNVRDVSSCSIDGSAVGAKRKRSKVEKDRKRSTEEAKDLRSLCLKIFCFTLNKYECHDLYSQIWDAFFMSVKPLIDSFKQDVSGSEKPSSLLLCFIAMSKNPSCISLLDGLLPTIFSILTEKTASGTVISSVLSFIENLLVLDNDLECQEDLVKKVLMPHLKELFSGLYQLFQHPQRKAIMWPGMKEIRILKLLGRYVNETSVAREFLDIMLPFFRKKDLNFEECLEGLHVIKGMSELLDGEASRKVLNIVSMLLVSASLDVRLLICDILDGLSVKHHSLASLAKLLRDLNVNSATELDEPDYDKRINHYEMIQEDSFRSLGEDCASVILSQCIYDLSSDLVLRQTASRVLISFIKFVASVLRSEMKSHENVLSDGLVLNEPLDGGSETVDANAWTRKQIQRIIKKFFLRNMGEAMSKEISVQKLLSNELDISIQKEWIILLREMVCELPDVPALRSLRPLYSEEAEEDFFDNILHLQTHRRAKALSRFRCVISAGNLSEDVNDKVFIPLFFTMMFEVKGGKGEYLKNACIESLAAISGQMPWKAYSALLLKIVWYIQKMDSKPDKQKILLRLMISVLDTFHFYNCSSHMPQDEGSYVHNNYLPLRANYSKLGVPDPDVIQHSLQKRVLPQIQKFLDADSDRINANMSLAVLKILKLLPKEIMESQLPSIIQRISNFLKSRLESTRDEARSVLAVCLRELGLGYLNFIVKVLQATLKRGYEMHVLGYTLNFILSKSYPHPAVGVLDSCLGELLSMIEYDILGDVSEEKEVGKIASKMKETRKTKSFDTLKLVSQNITFRVNALKLLSPIKKHLQNHVTVKVKGKLEMMLGCISSGIETNPSVDQKELFIFVYGLVEDGVASEISHINKAPTSMNSKPNHDLLNRDDTLCGIESKLHSSHLISVFALGLLNNHLKNMKLDKKDEQLLSMLDPFVKLLGSCLNSKYEDVLSAAFKCLSPLVRLPLPSLEVHADKIKISVLDIAQRSGNVTSPLMQSCLKLLTVLLQSTNVSLSNDQLHMLIQFPLFIDLQANPSHVALSLLKAIVARKLVVHEIYDLVTRVAELMITSQVDPIRKKCSQILLQFLLDYRLSNKRLEQHLDFLLRNLSYEHTSGREAVLEMLHAILVKFPTSVVENHAQSWFLPLVVALDKASDKNVQSMVATVIKVLLGRLSQQALYPIVKYCLSWYEGNNQQLWSAAAQVLGLMVDVLKNGFQRYTNSILPVAKRIMEISLDMATSYEVHDEVPLWKEAYYSLVMLEKMVYQFPELYFDGSNKEMWEAICKFLLHPHIWLRNISNRILALYFAEASNSGMACSEKLTTENLLNPSRLFLLAVSFCNQLKSRFMDDTASNVITQNLVFSICSVHYFAKQKEIVPVNVFWSTLSDHERASYLEAFESLGSRKGRDTFCLYTMNEMHQVSETVNSNLRSLLIIPLLNRIGKLALTRGDVQMKIVFNCFRMISSQIGSESCSEYAIEMLLPLYKVCEGFVGKVIAGEIKELASEVRDSIRKVIGVDQFVKTYNQIRKSIKDKRDNRKRGEKLIAVINPMRHALRKLRIAAKHRAHKKRKITAMKMGRWRR